MTDRDGREADIRHLKLVQATGDKESRRRASLSLGKIANQQRDPKTVSMREALIKATKRGDSDEVKNIESDLRKRNRWTNG